MNQAAPRAACIAPDGTSTMKSTGIARDIAVCFVAAVGFCNTAWADSFTLRIRYNEIHDRIKPTANVTSTGVDLRVRVEETGSVQQDQTRTSGGARKGASKGLRLGGGGGGSWRVAGPNQLINVVQQVSYQRAILVTVEGRTCSVRIGYTLNPGQSEYRYTRLKTGEVATARSVSAQSVSCSIE